MNTPSTPDSSTVLAHEVLNDARVETLPRHFGRHLLTVESAIYTFMRQLASDYRGGFWRFYDLSNGGFYMAPEVQPLHIVIDTNGYEGHMSPDAAGITACLFAYSHLSFSIQDDRIAQHYHLLLDFAVQHPEHAEIIAAID